MIGVICYYNKSRGFGFVTTGSPSYTRYFFHARNFASDQVPVLNAYAVFVIGPGIQGKPAQAIAVRLATAEEIHNAGAVGLGTEAGVNALKGGV